MPRKKGRASVQQQSLTKNELVAEKARLGNRALLIRQSFATTRSFAWPAAVAFCVYYMYQSAAVLAGKDTSVLVNALLHMGMDRWTAYAIACLTTFGYAHQRRLRRRIEKELGEKNAELERMIDHNRSSTRSSVRALGGKGRDDTDRDDTGTGG